MSEGMGGGGFAIDKRTWAAVCKRGLNQAVAYLVMACGTSGDNQTTSWSTNAVEKYTGISRLKAKAAIADLASKGFVRVDKAGDRPRYKLWTDLPQSESRRQPDYPMEMVIETVRSGKPVGKHSKWAIKDCITAGWLVERPEGGFALVPKPILEPELIWLPSSLITGAAGEKPPVELVRQTQDVMTLRMFIDFYSAQVLTQDGGISRNVAYIKFERFQVGQQGEFTVWGFRRGDTYVCWENDVTPCHRREGDGDNSAADYFRRWNRLIGLGLLEGVPMLFESDEAEGEAIHPVGFTKTDEIEDRLYRAAGRAAATMLTDAQREWAHKERLILVPVLRHIENVALFGIARLKYRAQTKMTAAWWADRIRKGERHLSIYENLAQNGSSAAEQALAG